jgi:diguanylate cyclase (GGDEF)-like protein
MRLSEHKRERAPRWLAVRVIGIIGVAGGSLALITALMPPPADGSEAAILAVGAVSLAVGAALLVLKPKLGEAPLALLAVLGTALITITTHEGGAEGGTAANEVLYLWVSLYAFFFLRLRTALLVMAAIGVGFGWLLWSFGTPANQAATEWVVTVTTLCVSGLIVARIRGYMYGVVRELNQRASHDGLTGLLNRRALEERVAEERANAEREGIPISLLLVDIDDFKDLNDSLGHGRGDAVLKEVAAALVLSTRGHDAVARIGGDEFAVLLPGAAEAAARTVAEGLRAEVSRALRRENDGVTVSVGYATAQPPLPLFDELHELADRAMYAGKRAGGDRVSAGDEAVQQAVDDGDPRVATRPR